MLKLSWPFGTLEKFEKLLKALIFFTTCYSHRNPSSHKFTNLLHSDWHFNWKISIYRGIQRKSVWMQTMRDNNWWCAKKICCHHPLLRCTLVQAFYSINFGMCQLLIQSFSLLTANLFCPKIHLMLRHVVALFARSLTRTIVLQCWWTA